MIELFIRKGSKDFIGNIPLSLKATNQIKVVSLDTNLSVKPFLFYYPIHITHHSLLTFGFSPGSSLYIVHHNSGKMPKLRVATIEENEKRKGYEKNSVMRKSEIIGCACEKEIKNKNKKKEEK